MRKLSQPRAQEHPRDWEGSEKSEEKLSRNEREISELKKRE